MAWEQAKPSDFTDSLNRWSNESNGYDNAAGDTTTYASADIGADGYPSIIFHTWGAKGETYWQTKLGVKWKTSVQTGDDQFGIQYTKDGGSNWLDLVPIGVNRSSSIKYEEAWLDNDQNLNDVQVRINTEKIGGGDGCDLQIYDIWTEGKYSHDSPEFDIDGVIEKPDGVEFDIGGVVERDTEAAAGGKVTLNTRSHPLGVRAGMGFGMGG